MGINANTDIYDRAVDRAAMIRLYERRIGSKVLEEIKGHEIKVSDLVRMSYDQGLAGKKFREELDILVLKHYDNLNTITKRSLLDLAVDQVVVSYNSLYNSIGKIWKVEKPHRVAEDIVLNRPLYSDTTLLQGWANVASSERKRLEQVIRKGIADGKNVDDIALSVRKGNVFNISRSQAIGLVRTAITSVTAQTDYEVLKANGKALKGWQYVAVLDSRTTPICAHRDGHIYPIEDTSHLPPAHFNCRSTIVPIVKSYDQLGGLEGVSQIRKRNFSDLTPKQIAYYDGQSPQKESYQEWLSRQKPEVQLRHLGDLNKLEMFREGKITVDKFSNAEGRSLGIKELRALSDGVIPGDTNRFANAKMKLDTIKLGAARPEDLLESQELTNHLREYYKLQAGELDGILSYTNYRGNLIHTKKATRQRVLQSPPREENLRYNPITGRYDDTRMFQPSPTTLKNSLKLVTESDVLKDVDKEYITNFVNSLADYMSINERAVVTENLRILFTRFRNNKEPWLNMKAVIQGQLKFDVMNVSDYMETQLRKDANLLNKLKLDNYIDPVLGPVQLQDLHDNFMDNIWAKNKWEDKVAPKIAKELRGFLDLKIPFRIRSRMDDKDLKAFYLRFANRLSMADSPDRDQLAVNLGRDLFNGANLRGSRQEWYKLGVKLLDDAADKGFYELETYGVQKRRMKSRLSGQYFGPYYDTFSVNLRIVDPRIQEYARLTRKVELGLRVAVTDPKNRLKIRKGYKTYFDRWNRDTRIPITSTHSFSEFPTELVDDDLADALNWTAGAEYKVDKDFYDFINNLLNFRDDKGKAQYYDDLNIYRTFISTRGDSYERLKAMEWLRKGDTAFSNHPFLDHRARIYDRGLISPQSGEVFRPFLSTAKERNFSEDAFYNLQDQIGAFLGDVSDELEGKFNSLSFLGRQGIATKYRKDLIDIGDLMLRNKPNDVRKILESPFMAHFDGEEQGKVLRLALEMAKINQHLGGDFSAKSLKKLTSYKTGLAIEQDASSSGAQIIALTTKNKQLAALTNVVPTDQKRRLYDEIAAATFRDPRFIKLNQRLGLTEKDLRKAAKMQNMVTLYGAGERTGILNVEAKLAKVLGKDSETLVVKAKDRDTVLSEISARMARYEKYDPEMYQELKALRQDVKDIFNKGLAPGDDILEQLWFLDDSTRALVEKMTQQYERVVTPDDFEVIAGIMSENLKAQTPILKDFTKFLGRLGADFMEHAKPSESSRRFSEILKEGFYGERRGEPPDYLKRLPGWDPNGGLAQALYGVRKKKPPKSWTNIPWVNFDGKIVEQHFTQVFEERLNYKDIHGNWVTNILQVPQKTDPTFWEELWNKSGKINDIADVSRARTAFAVNGNHSNDAVIVKKFHLWGKKNEIPTSTIHDAFFTNAADMTRGRKALREIYAEMVNRNSIKLTLDEMYRRGLPKKLYYQYLNEAIDVGLIPVPGRSRIGGRLLTEKDILSAADILEHTPDGFVSNHGWYGVG